MESPHIRILQWGVCVFRPNATTHQISRKVVVDPHQGQRYDLQPQDGFGYIGHGRAYSEMVEDVQSTEHCKDEVPLAEEKHSEWVVVGKEVHESVSCLDAHRRS